MTTITYITSDPNASGPDAWKAPGIVKTMKTKDCAGIERDERGRKIRIDRDGLYPRLVHITAHGHHRRIGSSSNCIGQH